MSLFGGDDDLSLSEASNDAVPRPPSEPRSHPSQNAPIPPLVSFSLDSDEDHQFADESESETESEQEPSRPNRFLGQPQTWRRYTAADRQIAASLEKIECEDLAAHLFNAYNLKRRVRKPTEQLARMENSRSKEAWLKNGEELQFTNPLGEEETELVPKDRWTAWPLPPKHVPSRNDEMRQVGCGEGEWYIQNSKARDPGQEMREGMLSLFMRMAKENWDLRGLDGGEASRHLSNRCESRAESAWRSMRAGTSPDSAIESRSQSAPSNIKRDLADESHRLEVDNVVRSSSLPAPSDPEERFAHIPVKKGTTDQESAVNVAFLADDDKAKALLQPCVDSVLCQLDDLALAVRRSRQNHFAPYSGWSGSEFTSDAESVVSGSKATAKSRSKSQLARSRKGLSPFGQDDCSEKRLEPKLPKSQQFYDSDSASDYGADYREENSDENDPPSRIMPKSGAGWSKKTRQRSVSSSASHVTFQTRAMDWSEVLGIAAVTGWNTQAVTRTAQRCAVLFDEAMSFRKFDVDLATQPIPEAVQYTPSTVSAPANLSPKDPAIASKRPYFLTGTLRCPHSGCKHSKQDFAQPFRVVEHIRRAHGYDPRTNDSDNEERTLNGVHIDGFLHPVTAKKGWQVGGRSGSRGPEKNVRKKRKVEGSTQLDAGKGNDTGMEEEPI